MVNYRDWGKGWLSNWWFLLFCIIICSVVKRVFPANVLWLGTLDLVTLIVHNEYVNLLKSSDFMISVFV